MLPGSDTEDVMTMCSTLVASYGQCEKCFRQLFAEGYYRLWQDRQSRWNRRLTRRPMVVVLVIEELKVTEADKG